MATKVFVAADGSHHATKVAAETHESEAGMLAEVQKLEGKKAKEVLAWFSANFRVPKTRKPRTPKDAAPAPTPTPPSTSAGAATSAKKA